MLVLGRMAGQRIFVGENNEVVITVMGRKGATIYIGVDAEKDVPIHREEVLMKILKERQEIELKGLEK
jgi:carbon storage regulator